MKKSPYCAEEIQPTVRVVAFSGCLRGPTDSALVLITWQYLGTMPAGERSHGPRLAQAWTREASPKPVHTKA